MGQLQAQDFEIFKDGVPQKISFFDRDQLPLRWCSSPVAKTWAVAMAVVLCALSKRSLFSWGALCVWRHIIRVHRGHKIKSIRVKPEVEEEGLRRARVWHAGLSRRHRCWGGGLASVLHRAWRRPAVLGWSCRWSGSRPDRLRGRHRVRKLLADRSTIR